MTLTRAEARQHAADHKNAGVGTVMALLAAFCGGVVGVAVASAAGKIPATELLFIRFLIASLLLGIWTRDSIRLLFRPTAGAVWMLSIAGAFAAACFYSTLQMATVGTAMMIAQFSLPFIILLSRCFLGERLKRKSLVGIVMMVMGLLLLKLNELTTPGFTVAVIGFGGAISLAICAVLTRHAAKTFSPQLIVFAFSLVTCSLVPFLPSEPWGWPNDKESIILIATTVAAGMTANLLHTSATRRLHAGVVNALTKTSLLWAIVVNWFLHGVSPFTNEWAAYIITLLAVVFLQEIKLPGRLLSISVSLRKSMRVEESHEVLSRNLEHAARQAELATSCEFKFHVDYGLKQDVIFDARQTFARLRMDGTELRNGVLIALYAEPTQAVIVMDKGITTHLPKRQLQRWIDVLFAVDEFSSTAITPEFSATMSQRLPHFANQLSSHFPLAVDDANEVSNDVSFALA